MPPGEEEKQGRRRRDENRIRAALIALNTFLDREVACDGTLIFGGV